jgi:hypothetical protein
MSAREAELVAADVCRKPERIDEVVMLAERKGNELGLEIVDAGGSPQVEDLAFLVPS